MARTAPIAAEPVDAGDTPPAPPVSGEVVEPELVSVQPTDSQVRADAKGRIGNTATQAGIAGAIVIIGGWAAAMGHVDLDPSGPGKDLPQTVSGAFGIVLTVLVAWLMNRAGLKAGDDA